MAHVAEAAAVGFLFLLLSVSVSVSGSMSSTSGDVAPCPVSPVVNTTADLCPMIKSKVSPCLPYLKGKLSSPSESCCSGFRAISGNLWNQAGRTAVCECIKGALSKVGNYNPRLISLLPHKCHVPNLHIPPIDAPTNCAHYVIM